MYQKSPGIEPDCAKWSYQYIVHHIHIKPHFNLNDDFHDVEIAMTTIIQSVGISAHTNVLSKFHNFIGHYKHKRVRIRHGTLVLDTWSKSLAHNSKTMACGVTG